jgi:hypothetical protein
MPRPRAQAGSAADRRGNSVRTLALAMLAAGVAGAAAIGTVAAGAGLLVALLTYSLGASLMLLSALLIAAGDLSLPPSMPVRHRRLASGV